ncbi:hypothetical protein DKX38_002189 [Salix brachista]|uniref:Uncharacterized protein n=1 Tax=Salix brachista TaxID=2182728 RepID=A0A5N5NQ79_9ROSI|nr:hypothetical protein DKX38_002189 [Salix brachista]
MARKTRAFLDYSALFQLLLVLPSIYTSPMVIVDSKKPRVSELVIPKDQFAIISYVCEPREGDGDDDDDDGVDVAPAA